MIYVRRFLSFFLEVAFFRFDDRAMIEDETSDYCVLLKIGSITAARKRGVPENSFAFWKESCSQVNCFLFETFCQGHAPRLTEGREKAR